MRRFFMRLFSRSKQEPINKVEIKEQNLEKAPSEFQELGWLVVTEKGQLSGPGALEEIVGIHEFMRVIFFADKSIFNRE